MISTRWSPAITNATFKELDGVNLDFIFKHPDMMAMPRVSSLLLIIVLFSCSQPVLAQSKGELIIPLIGWDDTNVPVRNLSDTYEFYSRADVVDPPAVQMVLDQANANPDLLPEHELKVEQFSTSFEKAVCSCHFSSSLKNSHTPCYVQLGVKKVMEVAQQNHTFCMGNYDSDTILRSGVAGTKFGVCQLSASATTSRLDSAVDYPYVSRMVASITTQADVMVNLLHDLAVKGGIGWTDIAILATSEEYGLELAQAVISGIEEDPLLRLATFQQYTEYVGLPTVQMQEIKRSGARIILYLAFADIGDILEIAEDLDLVGPDYVWIVSDYTYAVNFEATPEAERSISSRGFLAVAAYAEPSLELLGFLQMWMTADQEKYPGSGPDPAAFPTPYTFLSVDMTWTAVYAAHILYEQGVLEEATAEDWTRAIRQVNFTGVTGRVQFLETGERPQTFGVYNWITEEAAWTPVATRTMGQGIQYLPDQDIIWPDNTTKLPDLDIRPPFNYWSCHDGKEKEDPTGKTIKLHRPDGDDVDEISEHYHCDQFVDCHNLSDETDGCLSYAALYIGFGIATGILILVALGLAIFVIVFGYVLKYRRIRAASPLFLLLILASIIVGLSSIFAWFGKPHPVACGFQPWLLGLSAISMISALSVRTFRVWRIFRFPMAKVRITNFELVALWALLMLPALFVLVLWTIISTPTASMKKLDGVEHYVCTTGGFTGEPGGLIFFFILVGYGTLVLLAGMILSILGRKIPSHFNETRLNTISIYNIALLSAVIIPVFLAVNPYNPMLAWIFRTVSVLYVFTATMLLQFVPKLVGIFIVDKGKNPFLILNTISNKLSASSSAYSEGDSAN